MNAPTRISPARQRYEMIVKHHLPLCDGEELEHRCALLMTRDKATSQLNRCSDEARPIVDHITRLVTEYAFRTLPLSELHELRYRVTMLTACASGLEMFAYRLAFPEEGANAGG